MKVELSFLRRRLGHRIFWLFVVCALLPISLLAFVTWLNVTSQLREQNRRQLVQLTREVAMTVFERLGFLQDSLEPVASEMQVNSGKGFSSADLSASSANLPGNSTESLYSQPGTNLSFCWDELLRKFTSAIRKKNF